MLRQTSKQMAKEICHDNISSISTQRTKYRRRAMSRQKIVCHNRTWEECNKSTETKKFNVATRFVSWMSTLGRTCRDIKAPFVTLETKESRNSIATRYLVWRQKIKKQYRKNTATYQFMKNRRQNLCRDIIFSCRHTDYCNFEKPIDTQRIRKRKTFVATRQSMS